MLDEILEERVVSSRSRKNPTFGNPFGLALYDKKQNGVRGARAKNGNKPNGQEISWIVLSAEGEFVSLHEDPVDYCKSVRQIVEASSTVERLKAFWSRNAVSIEMLRTNLPNLRSDTGEYYADILVALYQRQLRELHEEAKDDRVHEKVVNGSGQVEKSALAIGAPRRVRDKEHLRFVASQPCLVCGRSPGQAHRVRYAQPRALGRALSE